MASETVDSTGIGFKTLKAAYATSARFEVMTIWRSMPPLVRSAATLNLGIFSTGMGSISAQALKPNFVQSVRATSV